MFLALLNTPNFEFHALGADREQAMDAMRKAWNKHAREYGARDRWSDVSDDVNVVAIAVGGALRDGETIVSA